LNARSIAFLLSCAASAGCYLTLDKNELDSKAAGDRRADAGASQGDAGGPSEGPRFTTSLDTPAIELADGTTTRDPCVATTEQARDILTAYCAGCHAPPGTAGGFSSILDFPTLITLRSSTVKDSTGEFARLVIPGQPDKSRLYLRARNDEMPPVRPPTEPQLPRPTISSVSLLRTWIQRCLGNYDAPAASPGGTSPGGATPSSL